MKLLLDAEHEALRAAVRDLLTDRADSARVRAAMESPEGFDRDLWIRLGRDLDALGLVVPEKLGGAGAGHVERSVVAEELGRALAPSPFLASAVLATDALLALDDEKAQQDLLPRMVSGETIVALAAAEPGAPWGPGAATATEGAGGWTVDGRKTPVVAGDLADEFLVVANAPDGPAWFRVAAADVTRTTLTTLDPTRRLASVTLRSASAVRLESADPRAALDRVADLAAVALAAEQLGGLRRVLETTTEYAKIRVQFGRAIGSYQAVKHGLADMYCDWELGLSAVRYAAWAADEAPDELPVAAALVANHLGPAYFRGAAAGVQYHGGIGYTWEHDAHLFYKRAKSTELLFGSTAWQKARLADRLEIGRRAAG
ncbi:acyl-CoA dehydrogenase [Actinomadura sp. LD22]|uniref:Acyl-CoA dehydrogenase n=1 Tax=Actinomadura physcomitrii TaxID=2650748 RepID=A0A6I4MCV8_9ACTN|nr:acyl-CoA dehydrogenase family protein [Actinomadura physcomitrii]MWA01611.1 acyl-CoA dehydrogenase [Actinomadura physcomitrii]